MCFFRAIADLISHEDEKLTMSDYSDDGDEEYNEENEDYEKEMQRGYSPSNAYYQGSHMFKNKAGPSWEGPPYR